MRVADVILEDLDPRIYDELDSEIVVTAAREVVPDLQAQISDEGYAVLSTDRGLNLVIGASVGDGIISINIGSGQMLTSSGTDLGAVTKIIQAVYHAARKEFGQPSGPGVLSIDYDASHGVWSHIAQKLDLQYQAHRTK